MLAQVCSMFIFHVNVCLFDLLTIYFIHIRIPQYKGRILKSVATSWYQMMSVEVNNNMLKKALCNICQLLKLACAQNNVNIKKDIQALLELDSEMFEPLLN